MRVIIAGSRSFNDYSRLISAIKDSELHITEIVSGGAKGADKLGEEWADMYHIPIKQFIPDWYNLGKAAGMIRNKEMAEYGDSAIVFWDGQSKGSKNMIEQMQNLGKPVLVCLTNGDRYWK